MKTFLQRILQLVMLLYCCIQPVQAQTIPFVAFDSSSSSHYETYSPTIPIKVVLSEASPEPVFVDYEVIGGTATGGNIDYYLPPGYLTFAPGETEKDIIIYMVHDFYGEGNETIIISLSNPVNANLGTRDTHTYTIVNDDLNGFEFLQSSSSGQESTNPAKVSVGYYTWLRIGDVSVDYQVIGGTATAGSDYILDSGTLVIPLGQSSADIDITVLDDSVSEDDETIIIKLIYGEPNAIGLIDTHTYTILNDDDDNPPTISNYYPEPNSIQVPRDTYIQLNLTDDLIGVDSNTVQIFVEGNLVYDGSAAEPNGTYRSVWGQARRSGTEIDYSFIFLPFSLFDYEQEVNVVVNAKDNYGNTMPKRTYSFFTAMRAFGQNLKVNTGVDFSDQDHPSTTIDSSGNVWVAWDHTKNSSDIDIYVGKLKQGKSAFESSILITSEPGIQSYPVIAIDASDNMYVAWQSQYSIGGKWDIYVSKSTDDGITWSAPVLVNFSDSSNDYNQNLPAIAIDNTTTNKVYIACEDDRSGNKDIWISSSTDGTTWSPKRITTDTKDQKTPAITVNNNHVVYLGWTDSRNSSTDIYGTTSAASWANQAWVNTSSDQLNVTIAPDPVSGLVHEFWADTANGYYDIYYRMEGSSSTGISVTDQAGVGKNLPAAGVAIIDGTTVPFAAWKDWRNVLSNNDTDIYYAEKTDSGFSTNVLINDDIGTSPQTNPAVGVNSSGYPYIVWTDQRNGNKDIYYSGVTSQSAPLSVVYRTTPTYILIQTSDLMEVTFPTGAMPSGFTAYDVSVSRLQNPPKLPEGSFGICYDVKPSGLTFSKPVTIAIPHQGSDCPNHSGYSVYWYNTETDSWSEDGITDVAHYAISDTLHAVLFKTTHFTSFIVAEGDASNSGSIPDSSGDSGGSGGGCAMSTYSQSPEEILGYFLPYVIFVATLLVMSKRYKRKSVQQNN